MKFKWVQALVRAIQKVLAAVLLFFAYMLGFGLTSLVVRVFNRDLLGEKDKNRSSFWGEAKGYGHDDHDVTRQS